VLFKKIKWLYSYQRKSLESQPGEHQQKVIQIPELKCFYKGLGIVNNGIPIPKGKFIGKFLG
jgi:hypothetical protein